MESEKEDIPNYQVIVEKVTNLVKGENYADVEDALRVVLNSLKRRSIIK